VDAQNKATEQSIAANLDEQQKNIDVIKANDNIRLQGIEENRYQRDVAGLSSQINASNAEMNQGIANTMNAAADLSGKLWTPEGVARRKAWRASGGKGHDARAKFMAEHPKSDYASKSSATAPAVFNNTKTGVSTPPAPENISSVSGNINVQDNNIGNGEDEFIYDGQGNQIKNPRYRPYANISQERKTRIRYNKDGTIY
jgi:hypothetical protein